MIRSTRVGKGRGILRRHRAEAGTLVLEESCWIGLTCRGGLVPAVVESAPTGVNERPFNRHFPPRIGTDERIGYLQ
jgi:hypothetical protein